MEGLGVTPPDRKSLLMMVTPPGRTSLTVVTGVSADISDGIMEVTPPDRASLTLVTEVTGTPPVWIDLICMTPPDCRLSSSERNTGAPSEIPFPRETLALALVLLAVAGSSAPREVPPSDTDPVGMEPLSKPAAPPDRLTVAPGMGIDGDERPPLRLPPSSLLPDDDPEELPNMTGYAFNHNRSSSSRRAAIDCNSALHMATLSAVRPT